MSLFVILILQAQPNGKTSLLYFQTNIPHFFLEFDCTKKTFFVLLWNFDYT